MAIYHYKGSPLIDRVTVDTAHHGIGRATIVAAKGVDGDTLENLRAQLGERNFSTLMDTVDDRPAIEVRGVKDAQALLLALHDLGLSNGEIKVEMGPEDKKKRGFRDRVRGKALFLSALFYDLGNIALGISGVQRGRHNPTGRMSSEDKSEFMTGAAFALGDVLMTFWGSDNGDEELKAANQGLLRHLHKKGIELPKGDALTPESLHQSGAFKAADRWLRKHIVHIKCLTETAGGLFMAYSALKRDSNKKFNTGKLTAGLLLTTGWFSTFLLDKPSGHHIYDDDKNGAASLMDKVTGNPRGWIARPMAMGNNVANLWGSLNPINGERIRSQHEIQDARWQLHLKDTPSNRARLDRMQSKKNDCVWNVITACSFLVANTLFGMSDSKRLTETDDDKLIMNDMVLLSANVLAKQPEAVRQASIAETANYISQLAHVRMTRPQVEQAIRDKVDSLAQSSWAGRVQATTPGQGNTPGHVP